MPTKRCRKCGEAKPIGHFYMRKSGPQSGKRLARCKGCNNANRSDQVYQRKYRQSAKGKESMFKTSLKRHGLSVEQYAELLASQSGMCAMCDRTESSAGKRLHIDHDRACCPGEFSCGKCVRGLLCAHHNHIVEVVADKAIHEAITEYLERSRVA